MVSQKKLINQLKIFKKLGVTSVKQSLEDEGVSFKDIEIMRILTKNTKLKLLLKQYNYLQDEENKQNDLK